ncbi:MAG: phage holin family protein [Patescibacteria group bacterium]
MRKQVFNLLLRWGINSLGLWIAASLIGSVSFDEERVSVILWAGLFLAIINAFIKPIVVILSLPAIVLTLGLFVVVVNGLMVSLLSKFYDQLNIESFGAAIVTGLVIGLVNFLVTKVVEPKEI